MERDTFSYSSHIIHNDGMWIDRGCLIFRNEILVLAPVHQMSIQNWRLLSRQSNAYFTFARLSTDWNKNQMACIDYHVELVWQQCGQQHLQNCVGYPWNQSVLNTCSRATQLVLKPRVAFANMYTTHTCTTASKLSASVEHHPRKLEHLSSINYQVTLWCVKKYQTNPHSYSYACRQLEVVILVGNPSKWSFKRKQTCMWRNHNCVAVCCEILCNVFFWHRCVAKTLCDWEHMCDQACFASRDVWP